MSFVRAVIFDMDGTLVDTVNSLMYAMNKVLEAEGIRIHEREKYHNWIGRGLIDLVKSAVSNENISDDELHRLHQGMVESYNKYWDYRIEVYPGIYDVLNELTKQKIHLVVNTNKSQHTTEDILKLLFAEYRFEVVVGDNGTMKRKPDPEGIRRILTKLGLSPEECIYVGDSVVDKKTAENAGVKFVGVSWGYGKLREIQSSSNEFKVIDQAKELLDFLK